MPSPHAATAPPDSARAGTNGPGLHLAWQSLERSFDVAFGAAGNPLRHLGALGFLFFWWLVASGIYLFAALDTSVAGAYESIARLSRQPWYVGGWLRSAHRYAADAFVVVMVLHLLREAMLGRFRAFRRHSWWTGLPLLLFAFVAGIGGFWLHWTSSAILARRRPSGSMRCRCSRRRSRATSSTLPRSETLFSLFVFVHLGCRADALRPRSTSAHRPCRGVSARRLALAQRPPAGAGVLAP